MNAVWSQAPLHGRVLIEASAGTGKTHQIALLVLRLLLEARCEGADGPAFLDIRQILVVTFTDAAAAELRARIRARIVQAERLLAGNADRDSAEAELLEWLQALASSAGQTQQLLIRLRLARLDFDQAPISTIHSWCARVQRELPLASGSPLGQVELLDESQLLAECFDDFVRRCTQGPPSERPRYATLLLFRRDQLLSALQELRNHPRAQLEPVDTRVLERVPQLLEQVRAPAWQATLLTERQAQLKPGSAFGKRIDETLPELSAQAEQWPFDQFTRESLDKARKAASGGSAAQFDLLIEIGEQLPQSQRVLFALALEQAWQWCTAELQRRSEQRGGQGYSALIGNLHQGLHGDGGAELAQRLRLQHPHALIDEFQDTDQLQFEIFDRIYAPAVAAQTSLHLIGDPKQAIYGFRGGDLAAYLRAAGSVASRWSITTNWRATAAAVDALNQLYGLTGGGFAHPQIRYEQVSCGQRLADRPWTDAGQPVATGMRWWMDAEPDRSMERQQQRVLEACANRIAQLLGEQRWRFGEKTLCPADIAVLAYRHRDLVQLRELLVARGVPCASAGRLSLADVPVAAELQLILEAVLAHDDDALLRAALATPLLGLDLGELEALAQQQARWLAQVQRFIDWRWLLERRGVLALVEQLLAERAAAELSHHDGERRLTDLRHLGEWLQAQTSGATPAQVLGALRQLREQGLDQTAEQQLRTETDAQRVQLLTVFAAKGLQFPVVMLPLLWRPTGAQDPHLLRFHEAQDGQMRFDAGSAAFEQHAQLAQAELQAETRRSLYVALTRAMYISEIWCSTQPRFSRDSRRAPLELLLDDIAASNEAAVATELLADLPAHQTLPLPAPGWPVRYQHQQPQPQRRSRQDFPEPRPAFVLHSFSGLTQQRDGSDHSLPQAAADEAAPWLPHAAPPTADLLHALGDARLQGLSAQRGVAFGNASHHILELAEPEPLWPQQQALVEQALREQGFALSAADAEWVQLLAQRLDQVRHADLGGGLRLAELPPARQVREFEFHFPLQGVSLARLRHITRQHGQPQLLPPWLEHGRLKGLMTGFIDLVYCHKSRYGVLDYKSNWLGDTLAHYQPQALAAAMQQEFYPLQALIYSIALHRYLRARLPGYDYQRHHAGALYVYLRAAGLEEQAGICRLRFDAPLLHAFNEALGEH